MAPVLLPPPCLSKASQAKKGHGERRTEGTHGGLRRCSRAGAAAHLPAALPPLALGRLRPRHALPSPANEFLLVLVRRVLVARPKHRRRTRLAASLALNAVARTGRGVVLVAIGSASRGTGCGRGAFADGAVRLRRGPGRRVVFARRRREVRLGEKVVVARDGLTADHGGARRVQEGGKERRNQGRRRRRWRVRGRSLRGRVRAGGQEVPRGHHSQESVSQLFRPEWMQWPLARTATSERGKVPSAATEGLSFRGQARAIARGADAKREGVDLQELEVTSDLVDDADRRRTDSCRRVDRVRKRSATKGASEDEPRTVVVPGSTWVLPLQVSQECQRGEKM